jgi:hypothetical protein
MAQRIQKSLSGENILTLLRGLSPSFIFVSHLKPGNYPMDLVRGDIIELDKRR